VISLQEGLHFADSTPVCFLLTFGKYVILCSPYMILTAMFPRVHHMVGCWVHGTVLVHCHRSNDLMTLPSIQSLDR